MQVWILGTVAWGLALAAPVHAGSGDVIFTDVCTTGNGTASCQAPVGAVVTAAVTLTTATGDTPLGGQPSDAYDLSLLLSMSNNAGLVPAAPPVSTPPPGWTAPPPGVFNAPLLDSNSDSKPMWHPEVTPRRPLLSREVGRWV